KTVGSVVKSARESLGWTQGQLAEQVGVTPSFVTKLETNAAIPSYESLIAFCNVLALDAQVLVRLNERTKEERARLRVRTRGFVTRHRFARADSSRNKT